MKITTVQTLTYGIQIARKIVPTNALMTGDTMMILGNTRLLTNQSMFHVVNFHSIKGFGKRQSFNGLEITGLLLVLKFRLVRIS